MDHRSLCPELPCMHMSMINVYEVHKFIMWDLQQRQDDMYECWHARHNSFPCWDCFLDKLYSDTVAEYMSHCTKYKSICLIKSSRIFGAVFYTKLCA